MDIHTMAITFTRFLNISHWWLLKMSSGRKKSIELLPTDRQMEVKNYLIPFAFDRKKKNCVSESG